MGGFVETHDGHSRHGVVVRALQADLLFSQGTGPWEFPTTRGPVIIGPKVVGLLFQGHPQRGPSNLQKQPCLEPIPACDAERMT